MYIKLWAIRYVTRHRKAPLQTLVVRNTSQEVSSAVSRWLACAYTIQSRAGNTSVATAQSQSKDIQLCGGLLLSPVWLSPVQSCVGHSSRVICHFAWHDVQIFTLESKSGQRQSSGPHWLQSAHCWISGVSGWPQLCQQKDSYTWMLA